LHEAILRSALAGAAAATAGLFLPQSVALGLFVGAVGLAVAPPKTPSDVAMTGVLSCGAGASLLAGSVRLLLFGGFAGVVLGRRRSGWARLLAIALGAIGALSTRLITRAFELTGALSFLPSGLEALVIGTLGGVVMGVASLGRQLEWVAKHEREAQEPVE